MTESFRVFDTGNFGSAVNLSCALLPAINIRGYGFIKFVPHFRSVQPIPILTSGKGISRAAKYLNVTTAGVRETTLAVVWKHVVSLELCPNQLSSFISGKDQRENFTQWY
jgi:hypothetical protein